METVDEEITARALAWMEKQAKAEQPFFLWYNSTAMHFRTHLAAKNRGKSGQDDYSDRMVTHDEQVGELLKKLDELGIADNTIVMYSTDNGPENDTWPDGANTPFRSQKNTNWEGAWRVPAFLRWPGKIKAGSVFNGIGSHIDMFPTLLAAAGDPDVTEKLLNGCTVGGKTFKVHLDGYNMIPYLTGAAKESPRNAIMYFSDDGDVMAVRVGDYKFNLAVQRADKMQAWAEPLVKLRVPLIYNLRRDPFERADINSNTYFDWMVDHIPQMYLMQAVVAAQIDNFIKFPPRQKPASFNLDASVGDGVNPRRQCLIFGGFPARRAASWRPTYSPGVEPVAPTIDSLAGFSRQKVDVRRATSEEGRGEPQRRGPRILREDALPGRR